MSGVAASGVSGASFKPKPQPLSMWDLEDRLLGIMDALEEATEEYDRLSIDHAVKEAEYKRQWHTEFVQTDGAVKAREAWAGVQSAQAHREMLIAEALMRSKKERMLSLRSQCDAVRTLAANIRLQT